MKIATQIKAAIFLLSCCFTATASYCQQLPDLNTNTAQGSSDKSFNYFTSAYLPVQKTSSGEMNVAPYLMLSDPWAISACAPPEVAVNPPGFSTDSSAQSDTLNLFANDVDSVDTKEANAKSITVKEFVAARSAKKEDGSPVLPPELSDKKIDRLINKYAEMISLEPEDVKNYPLYQFINDWYGVRYKWGGTDNNGIDCSAFSQKLYGKIYGVNIQRTARQQHHTCEKIKDYDDANEGDLVFFRIHHIRISHVGVYLANGYFVHASRSKGVVISNLEDRYWRNRYAGCGRIAKADRPATESDFAQ